jgi:hypothetical protein
VRPSDHREVVNVYVDESGDPGTRFRLGSPAIFVVSLVIVNDPTPIVVALDALRQAFGKPSYEFKFTAMNDSARERFFLTLAKQDFRAHCRVLDKRLVLNRTSLTATDVYVRVLTRALGDVLDDLVHANVVIDQSAKVRKAQRQLTERIRGELCLGSSGDAIINDIRFANSRTETLVQVADMIAGAVARSLTRADDRFVKLIPTRRLTVATILP